MSIIKDNVKKALSVSKKKLEKLEEKYKTAVDQYKDSLEEEMEIERANIEVLEEKLKELNREEVENIKECLEECERQKNKNNKVFYSCNNFEATLIQLLLILHGENMNILQYVKTDKRDINEIIKFWENELDNAFKNIGIKLRSE